MTFKPIVTQKGPYLIKEKAGTERAWCACGVSKTQPFCDGSHKTTLVDGIRSLHITIEKDGTYAYCSCRQTSTPPFCDGSHKKIN